MSKKSPSPPPAPDPYAVSAAQTAGNKETAQYNAALNRIDEYTPYGSRTYSSVPDGTPQYDNAAYSAALTNWQAHPSTSSNALSEADWQASKNSGARADPSYQSYLQQVNGTSPTNQGAMPTLDQFKINSDALPHYRSDINFTPEGKKLFDAEQAQNQQINDIAGGYMGKIQAAMGAPNLEADDAARQRIEQALMDRLNPQLENDRNAMESKLANQGITHGSEAYDRSQTDFGKNVNDARLAAIAQAGNEQSRLFQLGVASRELPLNEFNALRSASQVQPPQFQGMQPVATQPTDISGNVYKSFGAEQDAYNQKVGSQNASTSGLFGLGGSGLMAAATYFSDERLKSTMKPVGTQNGYNIYEFSYLGHDARYIGVKAQEIRDVLPEAVYVMPSGYLAVDYGMLGFRMERVH